MKLRKKNFICCVAVTVLSATVLAGCGKAEVSQDTSGEREEQTAQIEDEMAGTAEDTDTLQALTEESTGEMFSISLISPGTDEIEWAIYSEGAYCYSDGSFWGYLSEDGEKITSCIYEEAAPFSEGLACVCLNGKYGYIGKDGEEVIPFRYDQAASFREGAAYFSCGEEYGLIDQAGNVILELTDSDCDSISSFREGLAYFSVDGLYGYMDKSGEIVINPDYEDAGYFYEGLAKVMKSGHFGLIGKDGRKVLAPEYSDIRVWEMSIIARKDDTFFCFSKEGEEIFSGSWDNVREIEDAFCIEKDDKKGLADRTGRIILEPEYMEVVKIPGRELIIVKNESEKYGMIDYDGQVRVPFDYSDISCVEGGLPFVEDTGKTGLFDEDDLSVRIPAVYDSLQDFTGERAVAGLDEKYGVVRYDGTLELPLEYDEIRLFSKGDIFVRKEGQAELKDGEGNVILDGVYESIREWGEGYRIYLSDGVQYADSQGTLVVADQYIREYVYGAKNSHILSDGSLLRSGKEDEQSTEQFLLTNQITPAVGPLVEYLKTGSITADTGGPQYTTYMKELPPGRRFSKLYRMGSRNDLVLYFYSEPWRTSDYQESDSGMFTVKDGNVIQLVGGNECDAPIGGDFACFWYDNKKNMLKSGTEGAWGGRGSFSGGGDMYVYDMEKGEAVLENSLKYSWAPAPDGEMATVHILNDEEVSEEEYAKVRKRYRNYMPIDHIRTGEEYQN